MKQFVLFIFLGTCLCAQSQTTFPKSGIQWVRELSWEQVKEQARKENKYIFIDAFATWCGPCKKMDAEVYPDPQIGGMMNGRFISVKVQMDKTGKDNDEVRKWYPIAQWLQSQYDIDAYPSFLFFSPEGKLMYKAVGYQDTSLFVSLIKEALSDPEERYKSNITKFNEGKLDYDLMPDLARLAYEKKEKPLATNIARKFKEDYVDKLSDKEAFSNPNLSLLAEFSIELLKSDDRYFHFFYSKPELADSIVNRIAFGKRQAIAKGIVFNIISKEEISDRLYKDGRPIEGLVPDWKNMGRRINRKYGREYSKKIFPEAQIKFYQASKDWANYSKYVEVKISTYPPAERGHAFGGNLGDEYGLNYHAWNLFLNCQDPEILDKAFRWCDMAIRLEQISYVRANYMDTKANLLYKMGRVEDAIKLEQEALDLSKDENSTYRSIANVLAKMKSGTPTWPISK